MEILMAFVVGILFMSATYLMLSRSVVRIILGTTILSHGVHLLLLTMGGLKGGAAPLVGENASSYTDPLPQALILTAIVIAFGVTALFLVVGYRSYKVLGTDNMEKLRGNEGND
ncbi:multicomponent Na+:H+ antiporter subunit C [Cytobacillus horneckiae]|uniref:Na(+)/H(+) antiporter subunit C n=1 Tax=Cytobacillus horneckiae TaxID=549687 RepID=A0A2N0ZE72_9BACI|nr:Na(+)/H(+) antiporter subunit C [Cytobacillus horneckiae]NRG44387.1 Na(+)/H(+) antiporter subunit C [Bacillus sp. CRN 9]MBN6889044.1 Na(+)/H(+) antiporter subunit C [Cytobacillus horneckiae]MCM3180767.1 Na(+)/H(+) antiporter subunit C [Cytobacillus horneckiae]MEC1157526.1 Na(+)/H(+) antiporter subunit C [Cytobacillus horneckiae]MED2939474.1 Na(+)/H(+) antiporter subunit C [Cytobacillus horneckiae]